MRLYSDYTPLITHADEEDSLFCSVCGREIHYAQDSYSSGNETVCNDDGCMDAFYENNADQMLVDFAEEMNMREEAKNWFYDNL